MAKNNTTPKDEQMAIQRTPLPSPVDDGQIEGGTPSGASGTTSPVEGEAKVEPTEQEQEAGASPRPTVENDAAYAPVKLVVISARGLALRQEPSKQSAMLSVLPNGTVLTDRVAEETAEGWLPVTTRDGKNGWVDCRFVTVVD